MTTCSVDCRRLAHLSLLAHGYTDDESRSGPFHKSSHILHNFSFEILKFKSFRFDDDRWFFWQPEKKWPRDLVTRRPLTPQKEMKY